MKNGDTSLLAVLIDADNVAAKYANAMFEEIALLGEASIRRIYGDFSNGMPQGWTKELLASLAILPHQQFANTTKKNESDIALVIDAMDVLHSGRFDGFVLVSSDSDFTRLASRIREQSIDVYGMGNNNTPLAFRNACKRFIFLENLTIQDRKNNDADAKKLPATKAVPLILSAMRSLTEDGEWLSLGVLGHQINTANPDFDPRSYGNAKLSDLLEATGHFDVDRKTVPLRARIRPKAIK